MATHDARRDAGADLAVCDAATPGPWRAANGSPDHEFKYGVVCQRKSGLCVLLTPNSNFPYVAWDNILFAAVARTALPHWIRRAVDAEAGLQEMCRLLDDIDCCVGYSIADKDLPKFWEAQEKARAVLKRGAEPPPAAGPESTTKGEQHAETEQRHHSRTYSGDAD